jgi:hypothetical protein
MDTLLQFICPDIAGLCERLRAALEGTTEAPWFAGPLQPEDEWGGPGGVSVGPFDLAERYGNRPDYSPDTFNSHYESTIAEVSNCNHDAERNGAFIALSREAVPVLLDTLERQAAEIERLRALLMLARPFVADDTEATCDLADRIDAALTGEDTGGSPTTQNTQPGLAFSDAGER